MYVDLHNKLQLAQIADQFAGRFAESAPFADLDRVEIDLLSQRNLQIDFSERLVVHIKFYF